MATTIRQLMRYKQQGKLIAMLTAWDYLTAKIVDQAGTDVVLVGDSLAMVALGYDTTLPLTLEDIIHHSKAVRRGVTQALLVVDLPFLSYQVSPADAIASAGRVMKETGADAVKLEGGNPTMAATVERLVEVGIPVLGHVGLTPQSVRQLGGYRKQGTTPESSDRILQEAIALEQAGAFGIVLEHIPDDLAHRITETLMIPTIGIGAGVHCDGQVLVTADLLGLSDWQPPFVKLYANLRMQSIQAIQQFTQDVRDRQFPPKQG
jgi:3-methyl-2-oxobutanoate hydroxymethyltransferase